ncbi:MAG: electron transport complex subunit RsxE [Anaerobiospirillum sp.]|nr:electron transport complex subunit RsxE [Anaerobiospirillum sp.]
MSTEPNNAPVAEDQDAKAAAKARAIERARELAAKRRAEKEAEQSAGNAETGNEQDDEAKAAAKARAIERARELAAKRRAEKEAGNAETDNEQDDAAKAAAKARAIERARELAAKRRAEKEAGNADSATGNEPDDEAKAAAKARAIERARELAAKRRAEKEAGTNEQAVGTAEQANAQSDAANAGEDDKADAKAQAIARARDLAAKRKAQQAEAQQEEQPSESSGTVEGVLLSGKPKQSSLFEIFLKGIWKDNPGLCQLLGMCPLLAVTTSAANALGLGIATILVLMLSSSAIALIRRLIVPEVRIPIYVIIIAALVTVVRFEVEANFPALYQQLGIYLSLIATNCIIMGRAEAFAGHNGVIRSFVDAIASGIGFTLVLFALGSIREIVGNGTWLVGASDLLGSWAAGWEMQLYGSDYTLLIAILPPGGFFVLAFLIAAKNALDGRAKRKAERKARIDVMRV